ncbi:NAD(P)H-dependent oxidoreductase [Candidatus Saccharibacteria bacterium]|nr:NAD(P)H-dependent oxidoreductase [Candidatus Saccharibacteria bacterium]
MVNIAIILGSSRPSRFSVQPGQWIYDRARAQFGDKADFTLVDLKEVDLPFFDEPVSPAMAPSVNEHSLAWQQQVAGYDGFIFIVAEYNHSYSAVLKNAIDFSWHEWGYKPASFVSYGSAAGGARAVEHLRQVAAEVRMYDLRDQLLLPHYYGNLDDKGQYKFSESDEKLADAIVDANIFWAKTMKPAREALAATQ